jgi:3-oxoacyl-[acyl-carrier-protein] synthase-3
VTRGAVITGWGSALPERVVTNAELETSLGTSDAWIIERTGIRERRVGGTTTGLAVEAGRAALVRAGRSPAEIDLLILATTTPDQAVPATSAAVQERLALRCGAFDVNAACSGFVYSLVTAHGFVSMGVDRVLLIGSETLSRITDWSDRTTAVLFADGAAAVVVEVTPGDGQLLGWDLACDGSLGRIVYANHDGYIEMDGPEVFRRAVRALIASVTASLERAKVSADEITLFVPHQANLRIIEAAAQRIGVPMERAAIVLDRLGNTSSASIPLALAGAADAGRIAAGDLILLAGFGAGMTSASAVLRWGAA